MHADVAEVGGVVDRPAAVGAVAGGTVHGGGQQHPLGAGLEGDLPESADRVLPQRDHREAGRPPGRDRSTIPKAVIVSTADPGSSARTLA